MHTPEELHELNKQIEALGVGERLILSNIAEDLYHQSNGIGSTLMKEGSKSLAHYKALDDKRKYPDEDEKEDATALIVGSLTHCLVLEPDLLAEKFVQQPEEIARRQGAKWEKFKADNLNRTIYKKKELALAGHMTDSIQDNVGSYFTGGESEQSYWYRDKSGLILKARLDYRLGDAGIDLKTSRHENADKFKIAVKYDYDIQDAHYRRVTGVKDFIFVGVAKSAPYTPFLLIQGDSVRERAEKRLAATISRIHAGLDLGTFPHNEIVLIRTELTKYEMEHAA